jgi:hypothetical protein
VRGYHGHPGAGFFAVITNATMVCFVGSQVCLLRISANLPWISANAS